MHLSIAVALLYVIACRVPTLRCSCQATKRAIQDRAVQLQDELHQATQRGAQIVVLLMARMIGRNPGTRGYRGMTRTQRRQARRCHGVVCQHKPQTANGGLFSYKSTTSNHKGAHSTGSDSGWVRRATRVVTNSYQATKQ